MQRQWWILKPNTWGPSLSWEVCEMYSLGHHTNCVSLGHVSFSTEESSNFLVRFTPSCWLSENKGRGKRSESSTIQIAYFYLIPLFLDMYLTLTLLCAWSPKVHSYCRLISPGNRLLTKGEYPDMYGGRGVPVASCFLYICSTNLPVSRSFLTPTPFLVPSAAQF